MPERKVRTIHPEVKILSEADATVEYVASDASLDSYREIVDPKGARFTRFEKNAPFVDSHDYSTIERMLGSVEHFEVKGGQVIERVRWAVNDSPLAALGFKLTKSGHLKAVSIGFMAVKMLWRDEPEFADAVKEMKLPVEIAAQCRCIHSVWEQIELSACIIGANPNALAKAFDEGALKEEDLASIGFAGDAEFEYLHQAGATYESLSPFERLSVRCEMSRIFRARNLPAKQRSMPRHHAPGGDDAARLQAEERQREMLEEFSRKLDAVATL